MKPLLRVLAVPVLAFVLMIAAALPDVPALVLVLAAYLLWWIALGVHAPVAYVFFVGIALAVPDAAASVAEVPPAQYLFGLFMGLVLLMVAIPERMGWQMLAELRGGKPR